MNEDSSIANRVREKRQSAPLPNDARWYVRQIARPRRTSMPSVTVRYIVDDVDAAIASYVERLDLVEVMHPSPTFAMLVRGERRLVLSQPSSAPGGGQVVGDRVPHPGGWNRFALEVDDVDVVFAELRRHDVPFRGPIVDGVGGRQVIAEDPSGNPVELFQPLIPEARLDQG
jgi:catechol 2,3-dioxygenase-like lactoylglutathione lyase family enzyme